MHVTERRGERGMSMFITLMAMAVTALFVAAAFAAANGDLPQSAISKDRKATYAAAEAGLAYYLNHLQQDPDYWTKCTDVPDPNASEASPVNLQWDGQGADPRVWRTVPGGTSQYTIELLETKTHPGGCTTTDQKSIIDERSGTFKIRFTGRPRPPADAADKPIHRSIVATFRRDSFLNFVYFTDYEDIDPLAYASESARSTAVSLCANRYRSARRARNCPVGNEMTFPNWDRVNGPAHTNDESVMVCGSPRFGRDRTAGGDPMDPMSDTVEVRGDEPGYINGDGCTATPVINTPTRKFTTSARFLGIPQSNQELADVARNNGRYYTGRTIIRLKGSTYDVTVYTSPTTTTTQYNQPWPANGVIYVDQGFGACTQDYPEAARYPVTPGCGTVFVSGTYAQSLTIAARHDIVIAPTLDATLVHNPPSTDADLTAVANSDATLGLIADNFIRVAHPVEVSRNQCTGNSRSVPPVMNVRIEAAILSLNHSFIVDNWNCGTLNTLTVIGAIAQRYRGPTGTFNGGTLNSGYAKNYWYDDRFRYRSPPYFLSPVDSAWDVVRSHEQVPAR